MRRSRFPLALAGGYAALWLVAAIDPPDRAVWLLENLLVAPALGLTVWSYRRQPLSNGSYALIAIFLSAHAVGAHYTYSASPLGFWMQQAFGFERNHYDRVVHFAYGLLLALPYRELIARTGRIRKPWQTVFALGTIVATSVLYEIAEWTAAVILSPGEAMEFLGTQGDPFDAQKDSVLAMAGGVAALLARAIARATRRFGSDARRHGGPAPHP